MVGTHAPASEIPGLTGGNRAWVAMLIEDHAGMREIVWDPAFTNQDATGPFVNNHRYAIQTKGAAGLVDLGCWDEAWPTGNGWRAPMPTMAVALSKDGAGAILMSGGKATWLPVAASYDGKATPTATLRGAYLNWLLVNRGTTPSIPRETHWQRLQRGAAAVVRDLLTRAGGQPEFRIVGIGTSGRLLIPPGEGLPAGLNAVSRMEPTDSGRMADALRRALETVQNLTATAACQPGIVLPVGDGWALSSACGGGVAYEPSSDYSTMLATVRAIQATGQAEVWAWSVDGPRDWSKAFVVNGVGQLFSGDAVATLDAAIRAWMSRNGSPLQLTLTFDQPALTRVPQVTLSIQSNHGLTTLSLNGQAISPTGLLTRVPLVLKEGLNTFTVSASDPCGSQAHTQASITLDTIPPHILLNPAPPALTNQTTLSLHGQVDDPSAALTLNGQPLSMDSVGAFTATVPLVEGQNALAFVATDLAGNTGRLDVSVVRDTVAPIITFTAPAEGFLTNAPSLTITGTVNDPSAVFTLNGQAVPLTPQGSFSLTVNPPEGPLVLVGLATDLAGNIGRSERRGLVDRTPPVITLNPAPPALISATSITLQGQVDDPRAMLTINGQGVALDAEGGFSQTLPLPVEGPNAFTFTATDLAGNRVTLEVSVTRDTLAPVVHFTHPDEGALTNAHQINLSGQVDDLSATVMVAIGNATPTGPMVLDATGFFTLPVDTVEGPMTFTSTATDAAGNSSQATRSITVDWTAPVITLDTPAPELISAVLYTFAGRVDDPSAALTVNDIAIVLDAEGRFNITLPLVEGLNSFHMEAIDRAENVGILDAAILRDTTAPVINLQNPVEGLRTNAAQIQVTGSVDDRLAQVKVNGQATALDGSAAFTTALSPAEGPLTILVTATDLVGNQSQETRHIVIDRTAPRISLTKPVPALTNQSALPIQGAVDDPTAVLTLNGQAVVLDAAGIFTMTAPLNTEGTNLLHFEAADAVGNVGTLDVQVVRDTTPPVIALNNPLPTVTKALTADLTGSVNESVSSMTLNGAPLPFSGQTFSAQAALNTEGSNAFEITATDLAGNMGRLTVSTVRDTTPPVIHFDAPQDGFTTRDASVAVRGTVDDPSASLVLQGVATSLDAQGHFEATIPSAKEGVQAIRAEATDAVGNTGQDSVYVKFDFTPPVLAWANPTPAEGSVLSSSLIPTAVVVNEAALTSINGVRAELEPNDNPAMPFLARAEVSMAEGQMVLRATAVDGAGNSAIIERALAVGLTQPHIVLESPILDVNRSFSTGNPGATLVGHVDAPDLVKPLVFTVNGQPQSLTAEGRFSVPVILASGPNPFTLVATTKFGQSDTQSLIVLRTTQEVPAGAALSVQIDWPQNGFASGVTPILVQGRVNKANVQVSLAGQAVTVDPQTLQFSGNVTLSQGANRIQAIGTDAAGGTGQAEVQGTYLAPGFAKYAWEVPVDGARSTTRTVSISGQADQPGILSLTVNGVPMALSGDGVAGRFSGEVPLASTGRNALLMEVRTLAGETHTEKREVIFEPALPRIRLVAPDSARPGDTIGIQVSPEAGTKLVKADLSWNGRSLATLTDPFPAASALVPADVVVGTRIPVEAMGTDDQGATVTARAYVTVYGTGALMIEAFDDAQGLPLTDKTATASIEGGDSQPLDDHGRAALTTALPQNWIKVTKDGFTSVWRSAALQVGGVQSLVDARLTKLAEARDVDASGFTGDFSNGLLHVTLPPGALSGAAKLSVTPLSTQGLPGLLPEGWSAVSAWWLDLGSVVLNASGAANLDLSALTSSPALPGGAQYAWVKWNQDTHAWMVLAAPLPASALSNLTLPSTGGYALVLADPAPTAPPAAVTGSPLAEYAGKDWRDGLVATGKASATVLPTVAAINGAKVTASLGLSFNGGDPISSGTLLQTDVLESYTLIDQSVIEPDGFTQDVVAARWMLEVIDGKPVLTGAGTADAPGLGLSLPVRMSRTFDPTQLVEGRILVGFYHDGVQVASSGSELIGAGGGTVSGDGVNVILVPGAVTGSTLVRVQADSGDLSTLWPELAGKGSLAKSFSVDIVGTLSTGMNLSLDSLEVPAGVRPLLLERHVVQGQRLITAVGEMTQQGSSWTLMVPNGGNPVLEGGSFVVLVPTATWDWVSGTALLPASVAQPLMQKLGVKSRMTLVDSKGKYSLRKDVASGGSQKKKKGSSRPSSATSATLSESGSSGDAAVADVSVDAGYILAVSGSNGSFAVPSFIPSDASTITVKGSRWDLGVTGSFTAPVPSAGNSLRLATTPFRVETVIPDPSTPILPTAVFTLLTSAPADPATTGGLSFLKESLASDGTIQRTPLAVTTSLNQDGRTLMVTPAASLDIGATFHLVINGLAGIAGDSAPLMDLTYSTAAVQAPPPVDFSRIKLSYPDTNLNVTITVPEGAIPPRASLDVEAPGMGSVYTGFMPPIGDQTFTLKASLGERLHARTQLVDGRVFEGYISRYESNDGSGRVTVGIDGGRVEAADGSCSVTLPTGTIDHPVEFKAKFVPELPDDLLPEAAVPIWGRVQLLAKENVAFTKIPRIEAAAPAGAEDLGVFQGFGTYAVCFKNTIFGPDGQPASVWEFLDTAQVDAGKLKGMGGLPWASSLDGLADQPPPTSIRVGASRQTQKAERSLTTLIAGVDTPQCPVGMSDYPLPTSYFNAARLYDMLSRLGFGYYGGGSNYNSEFSVELDGMIVQNPGKVIYKGRAKTQLPITLGGRRYDTVGAPVFYSAGSAADVKLNGRLVQRTSDCGTYMVMNAMFADDPLKEGGAFLGVEPDYGISQVRIPLSTPWMDDTKHGRKLYQVPDFVFEVQATQLGDQTSPWLDLSFAGAGLKGADMTAAGPVDAVVMARDNKDGMALQVEVRVDDVQAALCGTTITGGADSSSYSFKGVGTIGVWSVHLNLAEGSHRVMALVTDKSGNTSKTERIINVMDFSGASSVVTDPTKPPSFDVIVSGGKDAAKPDTLVKVQFSEPVQNVSTDSLHFEKLVDSNWLPIKDARLKLAEVTAGHVALAWFLPSSPLELDGHYRVLADSTITDWDSDVGGSSKTLVQSPVEFHIQAHMPLGSVQIAKAGKIASIGRSVFVADGNNQIHMLLAMDYGVQDQGTFGDFQGQSVDALMAFDGVAVDGVPYPGLLLVTTSPSGSAYNQNCVLWGYSFCAGTGTVQPLFNLSLGLFGTGYSPQVDYRDGIIAVGRLAGSVALVRLADVLTKAPYSPALAVSPAGSGQGGIFQAFYLADPEYIYNNSATQGVNYGVSLVPVPGSDQGFIRTLVGFGGDYTAQLKGVQLAGLPSFWLPYTVGGTYKPIPVFVADAMSKAISETRQAAPANAYASTGVVDKAVTQVATWPNANLTVGGAIRNTTLGLGISLHSSGAGGNSLVLMDVNVNDGDASPKLWFWPQVSPFGAGIAYEIQYRKLSVDAATGLCAVEVKNGNTEKMTWFILDLSHPDNLQVVDSFLDSEGAGGRGTLSYGVFSATNANGVSVWKVLDLQGVATLQALVTPKHVESKAKEPLAHEGPEAQGATQPVSERTLAVLKNKMSVAARVQAVRDQLPKAPSNCNVTPTNSLKLGMITINQGVEELLYAVDADKYYAGNMAFRKNMPVIANRPATIRIYPLKLDDNAYSNVPVTLKIQNNGSIVYLSTQYINVDQKNTDFNKPGNAVSFDIPWDLITTSTFITALVDVPLMANGTYVYYEDKSDNWVGLPLKAQKAKKKTIYLIPMRYSYTDPLTKNKIIEGYDSSEITMQSVKARLKRQLRAMYPVSFLDNDNEGVEVFLANEVGITNLPSFNTDSDGIKFMDVGGDTKALTILDLWDTASRKSFINKNAYVMALLKPISGQTNTNCNIPNGGLSYHNWRYSIALNYADISTYNTSVDQMIRTVILHELGHTHGLDHILAQGYQQSYPQEESGYEKLFPGWGSFQEPDWNTVLNPIDYYNRGRIGAPGRNNNGLNFDQTSKNYFADQWHYFDLMTYVQDAEHEGISNNCGIKRYPIWISDYCYNELFLWSQNHD